jgi:hypothetical protein
MKFLNCLSRELGHGTRPVCLKNNAWGVRRRTAGPPEFSFFYYHYIAMTALGEFVG